MITSITKEEVHYVTTDSEDPTNNTFRRCGPDAWEVLMGGSWESHYSCTELENEFQKLISDNQNKKLKPKLNRLTLVAGEHKDCKHFSVFYKDRKLRGVTALELITKDGEYY
jgi:hypothetical protein